MPWRLRAAELDQCGKRLEVSAVSRVERHIVDASSGRDEEVRDSGPDLAPRADGERGEGSVGVASNSRTLSAATHWRRSYGLRTAQ